MTREQRLEVGAALLVIIGMSTFVIALVSTTPDVSRFTHAILITLGALSQGAGTLLHILKGPQRVPNSPPLEEENIMPTTTPNTAPNTTMRGIEHLAAAILLKVAEQNEATIEAAITSGENSLATLLVDGIKNAPRPSGILGMIFDTLRPEAESLVALYLSKITAPEVYKAIVAELQKLNDETNPQVTA